MERPGDNVLMAVNCKDTPKYLLTENPAEKRIIHYLLGCFHRKLQEDKKWKVGVLCSDFLYGEIWSYFSDPELQICTDYEMICKSIMCCNIFRTSMTYCFIT